MSFPEQDRAVQILEKEFGPRWKQIVQELGTKELRQRVGKELTSFMAFPERGSGGNNKWRGNCSPEVVRAILRYVLECKHYYGKQTQDFTLLDPMSGSGTSQAAAQSLGVRSLLYDPNPAPACGIGGWDALRDEVDDSADLIFLHPPYHNLIPYSGNMWGTPHKDDLSRCSSYPEFVEKLNYIVQKLFMALRRDGRLAILVGDIRTKGSFYSMQHDLKPSLNKSARGVRYAAYPLGLFSLAAPAAGALIGSLLNLVCYILGGGVPRSTVSPEKQCPQYSQIPETSRQRLNVA